MLRSPRAFVREPAAYFVKAGALRPSSSPTPPILDSYRRAMRLVALFAEAAAFLDMLGQELVFVEKGRMGIPVRYDEDALAAMDAADGDALAALFVGDVHKDKRLTILATAIVAACAAQPPGRRFRHILANLDALAREVRDGYRLFASEFTYAKIRRDVETAQFDYLGKIHKTFTDIQGQLLGIPAATVVAASQLKPATTCGVEFWIDVSVVAGSWIFVAVVRLAVANQWLTLASIGNEVAQQKRKLLDDCAPIASRFADVFDALTRRIGLHRLGLCLVGGLAVTGTTVATVAAWRVVDVGVASCLAGRTDAPPPAGKPATATTPTVQTRVPATPPSALGSTPRR